MTEYIKREMVCEFLQTISSDIEDIPECGLPQNYIDGWQDALEAAVNKVEDIPSVDVCQVRHGEWSHLSLDDQDEGMYVCSECKSNEFMPDDEVRYEYCPHCGAKMDGLCKSDNWIATSEQLPPENQIVDTKIDDEKGLRNECQLIFSRNLWWLPDKSMYVYYSPTHWRYSTNTDKKDGECNG